MSQKIKISKTVKAAFRPGTARDLYFQALVAHDGKDVNTFIKNVAASPPSVPGRGKLAGKQEPVQGWLSFFIRAGLVTID